MLYTARISCMCVQKKMYAQSNSFRIAFYINTVHSEMYWLLRFEIWQFLLSRAVLGTRQTLVLRELVFAWPGNMPSAARFKMKAEPIKVLSTVPLRLAME